MNIDCKDCGEDWCEKHMPMTVPSQCPGIDHHEFNVLAEGYGWCLGTGPGRSGRIAFWSRIEHPGFEAQSSTPEWYSRWFPTFAELNDWFVVNVISREVEA